MDLTRLRRRRPDAATALFGLVIPAAGTAFLDARGEDDRLVVWTHLAEPLVWIAAAWCVYATVVGLRARRTRAAIGLLALGIGLTVGTAWRHRPHPPVRPGAPPAWADHVQRCARALTPPVDPVRLLQWSLSGEEDGAAVVGRIVAAAPDVAVLHGPVDAAVGRALTEELGGEFVVRPASDRDDGRLVLTRGAFHRCGDASHWSDAVDGPYGTTLLFVGTSSETSWPLIVGRLPAPWHRSPRWSKETRLARDRVAALAEVLDAPSTIVTLDSPVGASAPTLDAAMLGARLLPTAAAPNWPARIGRLPGLPLHPWDRAWVGPAWKFVRSLRVPVRAGVRDPVVTELHPLPVP